jgi:6-phospho-beta-glucosidase
VQVHKCLDAEKTRGEICLELENDLLTQYANTSLSTPPADLSQRGGAMYSTAAISAVESIVLDKKDLHVVAVKNNGAISFMENDDVVEVLCELGSTGASPKPVHVHNNYISGLMKAVKAYEKLTVMAALSGSRDAALAALMVHPLIGDYDKAKPMLDEMLEANKALLPRFFS